VHETNNLSFPLILYPVQAENCFCVSRTRARTLLAL